LAWASRNARQACPDRVGTGSMPASLRICHTVDGAILYPQAGQLAVDTPVSPPRVVPGHLQHQRPYGRGDPGQPRSARREGPVPPDQVGVPAQQGSRGDDQLQPAQAPAGHQPSQRRKDGPVRPGRPRSPDLPLEHGHLVTQQEDLRVLGTVRLSEQGEPAEHAQHPR
jgi:hypothetical protein